MKLPALAALLAAVALVAVVAAPAGGAKHKPRTTNVSVLRLKR